MFKKLFIAAFALIAFNVSAMKIHDGWEDISSIVGQVSYESGVDAKLLAAVGAIESGFRPTVRAKGGTTSATGLYQFTDRTWRVTLNSYGKLYGLDKDASRLDPYANTAMGAEYLKENQAIIEKRLNRRATDVELYAAHLISPLRVVILNRKPGSVLVADLYPSLAKHNKNLFYRGGRALTKVEFFRLLKHKLNVEYKRYGMLANNAVQEHIDEVNKRTWLAATQNYNVFDCHENALVRKYKENVVEEVERNIAYNMSSEYVLARGQSLSNDVPVNQDGLDDDVLYYDRRIFA